MKFEGFKVSFDVIELRKKFPQLEKTFGPRPLVYLDSAASSLKHSDVTDRVNRYNRFESANVHRGAHLTSRQGTENYEGAREKVRQFLNAKSLEEIIFTRGTTEGINLVAFCVEELFKPGDEILITPFEHHSNIVPWQQLAKKTGAKIVVPQFDQELGLTLSSFKDAITGKTKLAAFTFYSNSFGNRLPIEAMTSACKEKGILTLVDGAQAVLSERIDVQNIGCDFLAFSGHKMYGPYGIGALYINQKHIEAFPPYQTGGSMIDRVQFTETTFAKSPQKFEAGTPNISGAIGLGAAVDILLKGHLKEQHEHVLNLRSSLIEQLKNVDNLVVYDFKSENHTGVVSFNFKGSHSSDVGTLLDKYGIAVRAGHHCTQPLMDLMGIPGTVRVSLAPYNTHDEINFLLVAMEKVKEFF